MNKDNQDAGTIPVYEMFIDYSSKTDEELRNILDELLREERKISYQRRILHGKIDLLRAELVRRRKEGLKSGGIMFNDEDIRRLSEILVGEALGIRRDDPTME